MKDEEILVPEKKDVVVGDRTYQIGRLSLTQEFKIGRFFASTVLSSKEKLKTIIERTENSESNVGDVLSVLDILDEKDIGKLFGVILKEDDIEFLINNLDISIIMQIVADVLDCNKDKIENVKKNIQRIAQYVGWLFPKEEKEEKEKTN